MLIFCKNFKQFVKFFEFSQENRKRRDKNSSQKLTICSRILFNPKQLSIRPFEL